MGNLGDLVMMRASLVRRGAKIDGLSDEETYRLYFDVITGLPLNVKDQTHREF